MATGGTDERDTEDSFDREKNAGDEVTADKSQQGIVRLLAGDV
jgi:hypothetical protein